MILDLPDQLFDHYDWSLVRPTQVNRSEWTGRRQVMGLPGGARWSVQMTRSPILGDASMRPWRAFLANLQGSVGRFRVKASGGAQHALSNPFAIVAGNGSLIVTANMTLDVTLTVAEKTGGGAAWNAGFLSTTALPASSVAHFKPLTTAHAVMAGLRSGANAGADYAEITRAFYWESASTYRIFESGTGVTASAPRAAGDRFAIVHTPGVIRYLKNSGTVYTSTAAGGAEFYLDSSFNDVGGKVGEIGFGSAVGGATTMYLAGIAPSTTLLLAGSMMTVRLLSGDEQLVVLTAALTADSNGVARAEFQPPLRDYPSPDAIVETRNPWCVVALDDPAVGWTVDPRALYGVAIGASEAF